MISYNTELLGTIEDLNSLKELLNQQLFAFNECSKIKFNLDNKTNSIVILHAAFYEKFRQQYSNTPSQVVIRAEQEVLSAYRSIKSNKHSIGKPITKKSLSIQLDKRLYSKKDLFSIGITTSNKRKQFTFKLYPKLQSLLEKFPHCDPKLYVNDNRIFISFIFENKVETKKQKLCLGVDLGIRVYAACSDGRLIQDKKFNARKRKLRFLKSSLQSKSHTSKSAKRKLKKLRHKEKNINKNQTHLIANSILQTNADTIALENLKGIKAKKNKFQNKNRISQVPFYELRRILTYKATNSGKTVLLVNPYMTSQTDSITGKVDGERKGRRFYAKSGLVYDADLNAARNIGNRSKLPVSLGNLLDGQAKVNSPIVGFGILQASIPLG